MADNTFMTDITKATKENNNFRKVLFTTKLSQLVVMSVPAGEDIGEETHEGIDQILTFVEGQGEAVLNGTRSQVKAGSVVVPAGMKHNFITKGEQAMKLYTMYTPPDHKDGTVHRTKHDAEVDPNERYRQLNLTIQKCSSSVLAAYFADASNIISLSPPSLPCRNHQPLCVVA